MCIVTHMFYSRNGNKYTLSLKSKVFPYSLLSAWPEANPGVQTVNPQVTLSHLPNSRLPLLLPGLQYLCSFHQMAPIEYMVAHMRFQRTTHLSTPKR